MAVAACVVLAACGGEAPPLPARTPTPLDHATTGTITGEVRLQGEVPAMAEIRFGGFSECAAQHGGPVVAGDALVADGKVENAFVSVKRGPRGSRLRDPERAGRNRSDGLLVPTTPILP